MALELSFVNSNLQLLKEQLAELNSSVELYQVSVISHRIRLIQIVKKVEGEIEQTISEQKEERQPLMIIM